MFKDYLKNIAFQLQSHNEIVKTKNILVGKPWAIIDGEKEMQKLIFESDGTLILSLNGQAKIGKWRYLPEAKSLLIDRVTDQILCNEAFINEAVMILKKDGTENEFFALANENVVPDLDVLKYLKKLHNVKLNIVERKLKDGRVLEIQRRNDFVDPYKNDKVTIDLQNIEDGMYPLLNHDLIYEINDGKILKIVTEKKYVNPDGVEIVIQQQFPNDIIQGDYAYMYGEKIQNGIVNFSEKLNLIVKDGSVIKLSHKNRILRKLLG